MQLGMARFWKWGWYRAGSCEKILEASLVSSRANAADSRMDPLATSEPISDAGGASGITD